VPYNVKMSSMCILMRTVCCIISLANIISVNFDENGVPYNVKMSSRCILMRTACRMISLAKIVRVYFDKNGVPYNVLCKYCQGAFWREWHAI